jgi:hypothetical protein
MMPGARGCRPLLCRCRRFPVDAVKLKLVLLLSALALALPVSASAVPPIAGLAPPGFVGIAPQTAGTRSDYALMEMAGVKSVRLLMLWSAIQPENRFVEKPDFDGFDREVKLAAEHGIEVFPFLWGTPEWAAPEAIDLPVASPWQRWAWSAFLRDAARRYGPQGSFWKENPELPFLPIRKWEIWNEENLVSFARPVSPRRYAALIRISGRVLHQEDPGAQVIFGGLDGHPLQEPPNVSPGGFLSGVYRARRVKKFFDGLALHPYVARASAIPGEIRNLRRVMSVHHDFTTPMYVTEFGWGSNSDQSRWERGVWGQARELNRAMELFVAERRAWRIAGVWWFTWMDEEGGCQFCDSAGLLTEEGKAKPAWFAFNNWTGGFPYTIPRADLQG